MCGVAVQVTKEEYGRVGQVELGRQLVEKLQEAGGKPYLIPVGGSSGVGSWGYLEAWREILEQGGDKPFTDIVMVRHPRQNSHSPQTLMSYTL
jgi:1-aminocyclopropane-1-carboxylate deaminase/D-cysteine desulfhydrase-like pyridoxal-dependent ACC family enzyme